MKQKIKADLSEHFSESNFLTKPEECYAYGFDNSLGHSLPDAVIIPDSVDQIQATMRWCHDNEVPFICRGRGTGTTGAAIPIEGGIVCTFEKFDEILEVNTADGYIVVQPGVTNKAVQDAAKAHGFFWAPDPTSSAYCTVGGNIACNAGGPNAVKYGACRENVLGIEAITGNGDLIKTGIYTTKGSVGYDLTRLMIGSEGTLGVITEAILKLTPLPEAKTTLCTYYDDIEAATTAIAAIMGCPVTPCVLEFIDKHSLDAIRDYSDEEIPEKAQAMLLIEVDGPKDSLPALSAQVQSAATQNGMISLTTAETPEEILSLWKTRKALSPAMRNIAPKKINEDVVVPVSQIPTLISALDVLSQKYQFPIVIFGHAGNGNIHVNLMINPDDPEQAKAAEECLGEMFDLVISLKGTLSGEHGVGIAKRPFVSKALDENAMAYMVAIKGIFDPKGILNPGKIFPEV